MDILYSLDKANYWEGEIKRETFITKETKLDFNITVNYILGENIIKISKQETDLQYRSVLYFDIVGHTKSKTK